MSQLPLPVNTENLLKDKAKSRFSSACADILWSIAYQTPEQIPRDKTWEQMRTEFTAKCWELFDAWETWRRV